MKKIALAYLVTVPAAVIVESLKRSAVTASNTPALQEPLTVLSYLAKTADSSAIAKKNEELVNDLRTKLVDALDGDELQKQDAINILETIADNAQAIAAEAPVVKRAGRKSKAEKEAEAAAAAAAEGVSTADVPADVVAADVTEPVGEPTAEQATTGRKNKSVD